MQIIAIPYYRDVIRLLSPLASEPGLTWYHNGLAHSEQEWFAAWPTEVLEYQGNGKTHLLDQPGNCQTVSGDFFQTLKNREKEYQCPDGVSFSGGYAGHLTYDLGLELLNVRSQHAATDIPLAVVGRYDWVCFVDHRTQRAQLIIQSFCPPDIQNRVMSFADVVTQRSELLAKAIGAETDSREWQCQMDQPSYERAFHSIQDYILAGDIYQANLTRQWRSQTTTTDDWQTYLNLIREMPAPFSVFQRHTTHSLLSVSPERFIRIENGIILTQPIKGTRPRGQDSESDMKLVTELANSEKDRAENLMIVDLLRNDIARNAVAGSVKVDKLFEIQSFKNVHHLVSSISAELIKDRHPLDVLRDAFPGGSITGAPKKRAMEVIDELETCRRGNYCGCSFVLGANGYFDSNILIRTITYQKGSLTCSGGGGIVHDSKCAEEYEESAVKVKRLLQALT